MEGEKDENIMKILIASDAHLGYKEMDTTQGRDSFQNFEEVFKIAIDRNADFVLLGGDLFHENKPSRNTLHSCMEIMKRYCLGDRPCQVQVLSDQSVVFGHTSKSVTTVNYEDPNINISMPVFSIHGNHDDPSGAGSLSAIDLLSVAGYVNHFGRTTTPNNIEITPVLLQKGATKIALYGLGSIRDERLHRTFLNKNVKFLRPKQDTNEWFNFMVIHQNRAKHGATNYIPEEFLDDFFDLVIWGHEHECIGSLEWNPKQNFHVLQPGSTVATSLSPGESKKKQVVLLEVCKRKMRPEFIPIETVRKMYIEDIILRTTESLRDPSVPTIEKDIQAYCQERVEYLIEKAGEEMSGHPKQPELPLIRLRIDHSGGYPVIPAHRVGRNFVGRVANPDKIIHFVKKSERIKTEQQDMKDFDELIVSEVVEKVKIEDFVQEYLLEENSLSVLSARGMTNAVREFVEKEEKDAIFKFCTHQVNKTLDHLKANCPNAMEDGDITQEIQKYKELRKARKAVVTGDGADDSENEDSVQAIIARAKQGRSAARISRVGNEDSDERSSRISDSEQESTVGRKKSTRGGKSGRGATRGRGRGSKKAATPIESTSVRSASILDAFSAASQRSRRKQQSLEIMEISDSDDNDTRTIDSTVSQPKKSSKRARGVEYESDENPFASASSRRKKR